jgi:hypothetical protein
MDMSTNTFCSSGASLPNGSFVTFGGNGAIKPGGDGSDTPGFDPTYQDFDGTLAIRVLNPCTSTGACQWFDNSTFLQMQKKRWYSTAESLADGSVVLIGGFVNGGYVNRNSPGTAGYDPVLQGGAAEPTYEFYPANGRQAQLMQFMVETSGLNAYSHAFLMPSGKMFVQANLSTSKSFLLFYIHSLTVCGSHLGLQRKPRDTVTTHAEWCCACVPCFRSGSYVAPHTREQLHTYHPILRWI